MTLHTLRETTIGLHHIDNIHRSGLANWFELLAILHLQVGAHVIGTVAQVNIQLGVPEDLLLLAKDCVRKFRIELGDFLKPGGRWLNQADAQRLVGIGNPYLPSLAVNKI